jgi:hypothetical protein
MSGGLDPAGHTRRARGYRVVSVSLVVPPGG